MNSRHRKTLSAIFANPVRSDIRWRDIESLLRGLGAKTEEGAGSRVHILLHGKTATFHRPHPSPNTDKGAVKAMRRFLIGASIEP